MMTNGQNLCKMGTRFYFVIRLLVATYVLYKLWRMLFGAEVHTIWKRLFTTKVKPVSTVTSEQQQTQTLEGDVLGKTHIVYLEDPEVAATIPVHSEKLPPPDFIGKEEDIPSDDVEAVLAPGEARKILEDDERYERLDDDSGLDPEFSTALTYDQMANAVNVLTNTTDDEAKVMDAAHTLYTVRNTDLFQFFTAQVSNTERVEHLLEECLDVDGKPLAQRRSRKVPVEKFDWGQFV